MADSKDMKKFVDEFESFTERRRPRFDPGKGIDALGGLSSAGDIGGSIVQDIINGSGSQQADATGGDRAGRPMGARGGAQTQGFAPTPSSPQAPHGGQPIASGAGIGPETAQGMAGLGPQPANGGGMERKGWEGASARAASADSLSHGSPNGGRPSGAAVSNGADAAPSQATPWQGARQAGAYAQADTPAQKPGYGQQHHGAQESPYVAGPSGIPAGHSPSPNAKAEAASAATLMIGREGHGAARQAQQASETQQIPEDRWRAADSAQFEDAARKYFGAPARQLHSHTDAGGGATFVTKEENGKFKSEVELDPFKERKKDLRFRTRASRFMDRAGRAASLVKPESEDAAASNADDKAIAAISIAQRKNAENRKRYSELYKEKKHEAKELSKEGGPFESTSAHGGHKDGSLGGGTEFVRKETEVRGLFRKTGMTLSSFDEKSPSWRRASFKDKDSITMKSFVDYGPSGGGIGGAVALSTASGAVAAAVAPALPGWAADRREAKEGARKFAPDRGKGGSARRKEFSSGDSAEGGKRRTTASYFSDGRDGAKSLEVSKSEKRAAKKERDKAVRKSAILASAKTALMAKKEMQNDIVSEGTGDLVHDGMGGIARSLVNSAKAAVTSAVKSVLVKAIGCLVSAVGSIVMPILPELIVVVLVIGAVTAFLGVFTDSNDVAIEEGDGMTYSSLSQAEIDEIINALNDDPLNDMNPQREALLRYALSKVGCEYNQAYHSSLTKDIFDCSSLAYRAYMELGIDISCEGVYTAAEECREAVLGGHAVDGDLKPGDLIFYGGKNNGRYEGVYHVAIYVGDGKMVEAKGRSYGVVYGDVRNIGSIVWCGRYL